MFQANSSPINKLLGWYVSYVRGADLASLCSAALICRYLPPPSPFILYIHSVIDVINTTQMNIWLRLDTCCPHLFIFFKIALNSLIISCN